MKTFFQIACIALGFAAVLPNASAQTKTTSTTTAQTATPVNPTNPQAQVTVTKNGKTYHFYYKDCEAYRNYIGNSCGCSASEADRIYDSHNCREGMLSVSLPACFDATRVPNGNDPLALFKYADELKKLGEAAFCKKYTTTAAQQSIEVLKAK
jgi:hypothetical protein